MNVAIVQPLLPNYRVPVFEKLARQDGLNLTVVADVEPAKGSPLGAAWSDVFEVRHSPLVSLGPFVKQAGVMEAAHDPHFDVVVYEWSPRRVQLRRAVRAAHRSGKGVALWGHGVGRTIPWLGDLLRSRSASSADACILYGPSARDVLIEKGYPPEKLFLAPNAIDQSPIRASVDHWRMGDRLESFRRQNALAGVRLLLYIGRLEREKRPDILLDALAVVRASNPDVTAVFVGEGSERKRLEGRADELRLGSSVRFLGAIHDEMEIAPWALNSVCLVQPESLGLSILHGFGYGLPLITCNDRAEHGPEAEVLQPGVNGSVYKHHDAKDLATKIVLLLEDRDLRRRLSANALDMVNGPGGRDLPGMTSGLLAAIQAAAARAPEHTRDL